MSVDEIGKECIINAAKTSMASKVIGSDSEFFSNMCVDAANLVRISDGKGGYTYPIKSINVLKAHGKSARESLLISGYDLNCTVASPGIYIHEIISVDSDNSEDHFESFGFKLIIK